MNAAFPRLLAGVQHGGTFIIFTGKPVASSIGGRTGCSTC